MIRLGLVGYPLGHSLSPQIHAAAFNACGIKGEYSLFPIHAKDAQGLKDLLDQVRSGEVTGLNVTTPHKQTVIPLLAKLSPAARKIGAVNTICREGGELIGANTDADGFQIDLKRWIGKAGLGNGGSKSVLVLGAGGAARAVVFALLKDDWRVTVAARRIAQARELADRYPGVQAVEFDLSDRLLEGLKLIVNATPVGMQPEVNRSPLPEKFPFPDAAVYDLIYNPRETRLVKAARAAGLSATSGLGMLIEQAALAFEIWTGKSPPRDIMFHAAEDATAC